MNERSHETQQARYEPVLLWALAQDNPEWLRQQSPEALQSFLALTSAALDDRAEKLERQLLDTGKTGDDWYAAPLDTGRMRRLIRRRLAGLITQVARQPDDSLFLICRTD